LKFDESEIESFNAGSAATKNRFHIMNLKFVCGMKNRLVNWIHPNKRKRIGTNKSVWIRWIPFLDSWKWNWIAYRIYIKLIRILFSEMLKMNMKKKKSIFSVNMNVDVK